MSNKKETIQKEEGLLKEIKKLTKCEVTVSKGVTMRKTK